MAKKFGKFLLFTAAAGAAIAGAYYYFQKKAELEADYDFTDEDYDDFSTDSESSDTCRSYVPLNKDTETTASEEEDFSPLVEDLVEKTEEKVEEFFDEEENA